MRYDTDFGLFNLWKDSERLNIFKIQTLARSSCEKTADRKTYDPYFALFVFKDWNRSLK